MRIYAQSINLGSGTSMEINYKSRFILYTGRLTRDLPKRVAIHCIYKTNFIVIV